MPMLYLAAAILFEVIGTIALKMSATGSTLWYGALTVLSYLIAFLLLWAALRTLPLGPVYATWSGIGITLTALAGVFIFKESLDITGLIGMALIVIGILLLNIFSSANSG